MRIAVCDDEKEQREYLCSLIEKWSQNSGVQTEISQFPSAESFTFEYGEGVFDLLLLDIQMGGQDGVSLARKLRERDGKIQIVFITALSEFIGEGYEVSALHYLIKPVREDKLFSCLDRALNAVPETVRSVIVTSDGARLCLDENDIQASEAFSHSAAIHTADSVINVSESFGELKKLLSEDSFFPCHRSYLVHLGHIERILRTELQLDCGKLIPVSRRTCKELNEAFIKYHLEKRK